MTHAASGSGPCRTIVYSPGLPGTSDEILGEGWSVPERKHRWATGPVTTINLPADARFATRYVSMQVYPRRIDGSPPQRLIVSAGGVELRRYVLAHPAVITFALPAGCGDQVWLALPDALTAGDDPRPLAIAVAWIRVTQEASDLPIAETLAQFISLGSNCEFGLAQRRMGAEPIDLFRFASSDLAGLCRGFDSSFSEMTEPGMFRIELSNGPAPREFIGVHPAYAMRYHTFIYEAENVTQEVVAKRELGRLRFLARKLIEDATEGHRMFVYWHVDPQFDVYDALPLRDALRRHNPANDLLVVEEARRGEIPGAVAKVATGLYRGTVDKLAPRADVPSFEPLQWGRLCTNALALWRAARP